MKIAWSIDFFQNPVFCLRSRREAGEERSVLGVHAYRSVVGQQRGLTKDAGFERGLLGKRRSFERKLMPVAILIVSSLSPVNTGCTNEAKLQVSAVVSEKCEVNVPNDTPLNFGEVYAGGASRFKGAGQFTVKCSDQKQYFIGLGEGENYSNSRQLKSASTAGLIAYQLCQDTACSQPWGDTSATRKEGTGNNTEQSYTVYGQLGPIDSTVAAGSYSDSVTVSVIVTP